MKLHPTIAAHKVELHELLFGAGLGSVVGDVGYVEIFDRKGIVGRSLTEET